MAESRKGTTSRYQVIFADFFVGAAAAKAHWYSLKTLHDDIPTSASLLGMSQANLNTLLVASNFGRLTKDGKFMFQKAKFASFLNKNCLQDKCELVQRQPRGFTNQVWFVKVGAKYWADAVAPGSMGDGPRIRNIRSLQNSFRDDVYKTTMEQKKQQVETSVGSSEEPTITGEQEPADEENRYKDDLIMLSIRNKLLPLIVKEEVLQTDFWTMVDSGLVESTMNKIFSDIRKHQDDALSEILGTAKAAVSPNTKNNSNISSAMKKYGVPLDDPRIHQRLLKDRAY